MKFDNPCDFFKQVSEHPDRIVSGLTIRDYIELRAHLMECGDCLARVDKTIADAPPSNTFDKINLN